MIGRRRIRGGIASWVMMAAVCPVHAAPSPERQAENGTAASSRCPPSGAGAGQLALAGKRCARRGVRGVSRRTQDFCFRHHRLDQFPRCRG
jgi:hypothetical protein